MKRLICRVIGHNWHEHPLTERLRSAPFCICVRCGETGWVL
jgi:hypothetical protein